MILGMSITRGAIQQAVIFDSIIEGKCWAGEKGGRSRGQESGIRSQ
ncbi:MAG: hypothetical protein ACLFPG_11385 [Desulfohalobiaceae bacterium]